MSPESAYRPTLPLAALVAVFVLDASIPPGIAVSTLYIAPVFLAALLRDRNAVLAVAALCAALTLIGLFWPVRSPSTTAVLINRGISLFAIALSTAAVCAEVGASRQLRDKLAKQEAVSRFGRRAISTERIDQLMEDANRMLAEFFGARYCKVLRYEAEARRTRLLAGFGWERDLVGSFVEPVEGRSMSAYTLLRHDHGEPLIVEELAHETRFEPPQLLLERGVRSCVNVLIPGRERPYGILEVDAVRRNAFRREDALVLQLMANLLGEAIERTRSEEALRESNRALGEFALVASHDLQEPLRKIVGFNERVLARTDDEGRRYVEKSTGAAVRMKTLIEDLLLFSKLETAPKRLFRPVDLDEVAREVAAELEERVREKSAELRIGRLPTLRANRFQMQQLFTNLLSNALKYSRPGVPPRVEVDARRDGDAVEIRFSDNGIGFDEAQAIFAPFKRLHGRSQYEGTGMGLAICRRIVEQHEGSIRAEGRPGQGATFVVRLPA